MNINFNIGFLKTVQNALMESLKKSKENLKNALDLAEEFDSRGVYISNSHKEYEEITALTNKTYEEFHKANGALKMVKLEGLVAIVTKEEEMTKGFGGFIKRTGENEPIINSLATLLEVTQNIIYYVEQLTQGKNDEPLKLFKDYKKLIEASSNSNVTVNDLNNQYEIAIKDLFYPRFDLLDNNENEEVVSYFNNSIVYTDTQILHTNEVLNTVQFKYNADSKSLLKLIQPANLMDDLSSNTLAVNDQIASLKKLVDSVSALRVNKSTFIYSNFVSAFFEVIKTVNQNEINQFKEKSYASVEKIINGFSNELANLINFFKNTPINVNYQLQNIKPNYEALKEVSFFICHKISQNEELYSLSAIKELNKLIGLNSFVEALNSNLEIAEVQKNPEVVNHFENVLIDLKEEVMIFGSKNIADANVFEQHMKKLSQLSEKSYEISKLIKIDLLQNLTQEFSNFVKQLHQKHITEGLSEELSLYVVFLDNFVQNYLKNKANIYNIENNPELNDQVKLMSARFESFANGDEVSHLEAPKLDIESKASEQEKTIRHIFEELYNDLLIVEEIMDQFFRTEGENIKDIANTIKPLLNANGVLKITQNIELSQVVSYMVNVFEELLNKGVKEVDPQRIYNTANGLGGLLLYISAVKDGNQEEAKEVFSSLAPLFKDLNIEINSSNAPLPLVKPISTKPIINSNVDNDIANEKVVSEENDLVEILPLHIDVDTDTNTNESKNHEAETVEPVNEIHTSLEEVLLPEIGLVQEKNQAEENKEEHNDNLEVINHLAQKTNVEQHLLNNKDELAHAEISSVEVAEGNEELVDIYLEEAKEEVFPNIESALEKIEELGYSKEQLTIIRRAYHTLKGSGRMVNLNYLAEIAWLVEQTLNSFLNEDKPVPDSVIEIVKETKATLENYFEELNNNKSVFVDVKPSFELIKAINPHVSLSSYIQVKEASHEEPVLSLEDVLNNNHEEIQVEEHQPQDINDLLKDIVKDTNTESDQAHTLKASHVEEESDEEFELTPLVDLDVSTHHNDEHSIDLSHVALIDVDENGHDINTHEKEHEIDISQINIEDIALINEVDSHEKEEASSPTSIEVDGEAINLTVYNLFKNESEELIKKIKNNIRDNQYQEYVLSEEFLRASHTLGSISRSVNLVKLADIAQGLELVAKLSIEKNVKLNYSQLELIEIVVEDLDIFKNVDELHQDYVAEKYKNGEHILNELEEELNSHQAEDSTTAIAVDEYSNSETNINEIEPTININHYTEEEVSEAEDKQVNIHHEDESMKEIDMEKLFQKIAAHIDNSINELKVEIHQKIASLEESIDVVKESHDSLVSKIESIKTEHGVDSITEDINNAGQIEKMKEEVNDLMTKQQELIIKGFNSVKKDLAHINGEVKKKSSGLFSGLFGKKE